MTEGEESGLDVSFPKPLASGLRPQPLRHLLPCQDAGLSAQIKKDGAPTEPNNGDSEPGKASAVSSQLGEHHPRGVAWWDDGVRWVPQQCAWAQRSLRCHRAGGQWPVSYPSQSLLLTTHRDKSAGGIRRLQQQYHGKAAPSGPGREDTRAWSRRGPV